MSLKALLLLLLAPFSLQSNLIHLWWGGKFHWKLPPVERRRGSQIEPWQCGSSSSSEKRDYLHNLQLYNLLLRKSYFLFMVCLYGSLKIDCTTVLRSCEKTSLNLREREKKKPASYLCARLLPFFYFYVHVPTYYHLLLLMRACTIVVPWHTFYVALAVCTLSWKLRRALTPALKEEEQQQKLGLVFFFFRLRQHRIVLSGWSNFARS